MDSPAASTHDVDHLRARVRLYVLLLLSVDLLAYVSDAISPLVFDDYIPPKLPLWFSILRWTVTPFLTGSWILLRFAKPNRIVVIAIETVVTFALSFSYIHLGSAYLSDQTPAFGPMLSASGLMLLLSIRAALVPSSIIRTVVIGAIPMAYLFAVADDVLAGDDRILLEALSFLGVAFVATTAVTSRVIYGLRRQVRDAMRLGQYALRRKLGAGAMGEVYEATHVMLKRPTAVKLLPVDKAGEHTVARFEREVQQTSRLEHPNSVHVYDYGRTPDGQFYYAMEYLDGVNLQQLVGLSGPLGAARARRILLQAANALAEAHDLGLVHRDIKPANVMVCERAGVSDTVKVLDFGLVKAVDEAPGADLTHANAIVGTPMYMAPEAIRTPDDIGPPSDVYALGAVGYYLITGRDVFVAESVFDVCAKHLGEEPESPSAVLGDEIDEALEALLLRCLAKDPADRPADGAALAGELEALELSGWTAADARAWWRTFHERRGVRKDVDPYERTMLTVDVHER